MNSLSTMALPITEAEAKPAVVTINGRFLTQGVTGVQRYALELIRTFDLLIDEGDIDSRLYKLQIIAPLGARDPGLKHIDFIRAGKRQGHLWEQFELPKFVPGDSMLINLCNTAPIAKRKQMVTIHDAAVNVVPQAYGWVFRTWYKLLLPVISRTAKRVFTVSQFSKSELSRWLSVPEKKCVVVSEGREHIESVGADKSALDRFDLGDRPFVLAVSSMSPNKNFRAVIEALQWLRDAPFTLVIAGASDPRVFASNTQPLPDFVKHVGYVSDVELKALYEGAACFVYPSLYEGFGLPPLEAMACGCPVIVSNRASLPEVCGNAALYCDAKDPQTIAEQIMRLMNDPELRASLSLRGLQRAHKFSWKRSARDVWGVIKQEITI